MDFCPELILSKFPFCSLTDLDTAGKSQLLESDALPMYEISLARLQDCAIDTMHLVIIKLPA